MKILKFQASWCAPCKMLSTVFNDIKDELPHELVEIDIDENSDMAKQYNIRGVPTLVLLDGDTEVDRKSGYMSPPQLKAFLRMNES